MTKKEIKQKYFKKVYENASEILCACGCGQLTKSKDKYGRDKKFINGHNGRKYDDPAQYKREWNHRNRKQRFKSKVARLHKLKAELIQIKGNMCSKCKLKYNGKNAACFDFHHTDPKTRVIRLNQGALNNHSREKVNAELPKVILLCSNCHRLTHSGEF